jgi:hypothetical protein
MPLHDHFRPPWSLACPWEGVHGAWATAIAFHLNSGLLPYDYRAVPLVTIGGRVEVDVATTKDDGGAPVGASTDATWSPPRPTLTIPLEAVETDSFEVRVVRDFGGPKLRAAIELVSPGNKDRPGTRRAFAVKCATFLQQGVSVIVIDVVTERLANLHADILQALNGNGNSFWESSTHLYAVGYRSVLEPEKPHLDVWPEVLTLGAPLPTLPLWLEYDLCIQLRLEESYAVTCGSLRMRG